MNPQNQKSRDLDLEPREIKEKNKERKIHCKERENDQIL